MKSKMINEVHVEGLLYDHKLEMKVTGSASKAPGTQYIAGTINVATDNQQMNVVPVHYTYVTATTATGKANNTFNVLKAIIDGAPCVTKDGADKATKLRIDSAINLNEWYQDDQNLVTVKRVEGGFIHIINNEELDGDEDQRSRFKCDMIIQSVIEREADPEKKLEAKVIVKGYIFNFRNQLLPVEFSAVNLDAQKYFLRLDCSVNRPFCTWVRGKIVSNTIVTTTVEESAFGGNEVRERRTSVRDYVITGAAREAYAWDDEAFITAREMSDALSNREVELAAMKKRNEEYRAQRANGTSAPAAKTPSADGPYNF